MAGSKYVELNPWDNQYIIEGAKEHPVMMVNGAIEGENIYSVICDDRGAMEESVKRLVDSGAKKLIYVYSSRSYSGIRKLEGFTAGAKETGLSEEDARIVQGKKIFMRSLPFSGENLKGALRCRALQLRYERCRRTEICSVRTPLRPGRPADRKLQQLRPLDRDKPGAHLRRLPPRRPLHKNHFIIDGHLVSEPRR